MMYIIKFMNLNTRLYVFYTMMILLCFGFPLVSLSITSKFGYYLLMTLSFIIGVANSITQATSFGLGNSFPVECISWLTTGTGISGLCLNLARIVCLLVFGADTSESLKKGTIGYFILASLIILLQIFTHKKFIQTKYFKHYMNKSDDIKAIKKKEEELINEDEDCLRT